MRFFLLPLLCLALPANAWVFSPGEPCRLDHSEATLDVELTHDPSGPLYSITVRRAAPWPTAGVFSITFEGGITISTDRQVLSEGGRALTVTDRGFGNVLSGMIGAPAAVARLGDVAERFSLDGADDPVRKFAACQPAAGV